MARADHTDVRFSGAQQGKQQGKTFICHAHADKEAVARPLAELLTQRGVPVWLDVHELPIGVRLRPVIDAAIAGCEMSIVILSPAFYRSSWAAWYEFDGILCRHLRDGMPLFGDPAPHHQGRGAGPGAVAGVHRFPQYRRLHARPDRRRGHPGRPAPLRRAAGCRVA